MKRKKNYYDILHIINSYYLVNREISELKYRLNKLKIPSKNYLTELETKKVSIAEKPNKFRKNILLLILKYLFIVGGIATFSLAVTVDITYLIHFGVALALSLLLIIVSKKIDDKNWDIYYSKYLKYKHSFEKYNFWKIELESEREKYKKDLTEYNNELKKLNDELIENKVNLESISAEFFNHLKDLVEIEKVGMQLGLFDCTRDEIEADPEIILDGEWILLEEVFKNNPKLSLEDGVKEAICKISARNKYLS